MRIQTEVIVSLSRWFDAPTLSDVSIVNSGPVSWFVGSVLRKRAMTFAPFVFFAPGAYDPARPESVALLAHELTHIEQYRRYGKQSFLARYFWALGRNGFRYNHQLPLEREAYDLQAEVREALRSRLPEI